MIKFCCYYCYHWWGECREKKIACFIAFGGGYAVNRCTVEDGHCAEKFDNAKVTVVEAHKDCWVTKVTKKEGGTK